MNHRTLARVCTVAVMAGAAGQAQTRDTPRLPWGDPDLEGTWTNATLTPLQRPAELGTKAFFTPKRRPPGRSSASSRPTPIGRRVPAKWAPTTTRSSSAARAA